MNRPRSDDIATACSDAAGAGEPFAVGRILCGGIRLPGSASTAVEADSTFERRCHPALESCSRRTLPARVERDSRSWMLDQPDLQMVGELGCGELGAR